MLVNEVFTPEGNPALSSTASRQTPRARATLADIRRLSEGLVTFLEDEKAEDILLIDLDGRSALADFMVIASGRSSRHVAAMAQHLASNLKGKIGRPVHIEGMPNADWVLIDTGDVIVHLFRPEVREFYNLEKIWVAPTEPKPVRRKAAEPVDGDAPPKPVSKTRARKAT